MRRIVQRPRPDWQQKLESVGFHFHSITEDGYNLSGKTHHFVYWREDVAYHFTEDQIERLYDATRDVHAMSLDLAQEIFKKGDLERLGMSRLAQKLAYASWARQDPHLYGRFDIAWTGEGEPKFLEYNADTPTSLIEASVAQWFWKEDVHPRSDQFNSIHESLVEQLGKIRRTTGLKSLHLVGMLHDSLEDLGNLEYLLDCAVQAGWQSQLLDIGSIGWNGSQFVDLQGEPLQAVFKLYPWEWLANESHSHLLTQHALQWLEPAWKQALSNKAFMALLWERYRGHPNLLPTYFEASPLQGQPYVKKPFFSREGANVELIDAQGHIESRQDGAYGSEGFVFQARASLATFDAPEDTGWYPCRGKVHAVLGAWVVGDEPVGMGIREDIGLITKNSAYFVPHYFD